MGEAPQATTVGAAGWVQNLEAFLAIVNGNGSLAFRVTPHQSRLCSSARSALACCWDMMGR